MELPQVCYMTPAPPVGGRGLRSEVNGCHISTREFRISRIFAVLG
jgi:hypothetical protein